MKAWSLCLPRVLLALTVFAGSPSLAHAANPTTVSGKVTDASGATVSDAAVSVVELKLGMTTGADGAFSFAGLPAGRYTLSVRRPGYAPALQTFTAPVASPLAVSLTATPFD